MGTYTVRHEDFAPLSTEDLVRYKDLSGALRNFEIAAIYNFLDRTPAQRQDFVCELIEHLNQGSERLFMMNGRMNCGPLCPRGRSCVMCMMMLVSRSEQVITE